jgi:hypothetical protein
MIPNLEAHCCADSRPKTIADGTKVGIQPGFGRPASPAAVGVAAPHSAPADQGIVG